MTAEPLAESLRHQHKSLDADKLLSVGSVCGCELWSPDHRSPGAPCQFSHEKWLPRVSILRPGAARTQPIRVQNVSPPNVPRLSRDSDRAHIPLPTSLSSWRTLNGSEGDEGSAVALAFAFYELNPAAMKRARSRPSHFAERL